MANKNYLPEENYQIMDLPTAKLERMYIEAYLHSKGLSLAALKKLPALEARKLMIGASVWALTKLAEVETRADFVRELHGEE